MWEWSVRIRVKPHDVGSSFSVPILLGKVPDDPHEWRTCSAYVGSHSVFANSRTRPEVVTEGTVLLQEAIAERSGLDGFEPDIVKPWLKENLHWGVLKPGGTEVPVEDVPSLEVTVVAVPLTFPPDAAFPVPGQPVYHPDVTSGRPGGACT
ncbi:hypothetical protein C8Q76DRAFT_485863 [Earliella scabrosa]|nr:hypothetical protein C8Q76DRAFT_485863 [Earliella scabrosa]